MSSRLRLLTVSALCIALVTLATMAITVPVPATQGYVNVGDSVIFLVALLLGPRLALLAGGVGSALADILLGATMWAPWTLAIKGLEGLLVGVIGHRAFQQAGRLTPLTLLAILAGGVWMMFGYFVAGSVLWDYRAALAEVPGSIVQAVGSAAIALPLAHALRRVKPLG